MEEKKLELISRNRNEKIVTILEDYLELAKKGEIHGIAIAGVECRGSRRMSWSAAWAHLPELNLAVDIMKGMIVDHYVAGDDAEGDTKA